MILQKHFQIKNQPNFTHYSIQLLCKLHKKVIIEPDLHFLLRNILRNSTFHKVLQLGPQPNKTPYLTDYQQRILTFDMRKTVKKTRFYHNIFG